MATKGFCILAQGTDYIEMAATAARSIHGSQNDNASVCLITNNTVEEKYANDFDHIVSIPWTDQAENSEHKIDNTWKYFWATPYDETIVVSPDMLVPADISHWWEMLKEKDMWFPSSKKTFTNNSIEMEKVFKRNSHVQRIYPNLFYFKQSELASEFFCMLEQVYNNWIRMYGEHLDDSRPVKKGMTMNYSLTAYILGVSSDVTEPSVKEIPTFVDIYDDENDTEWYNSLNVILNRENEFYISNFKQYLPIHYDRNDWFKEHRISRLYEKQQK